jgi:hypothetical protein
METSDILTLIFGITQTLATIAIAYVLYKQAKIHKTIEIETNLTNAWNVANSVALSSNENLETFESMGKGKFISPEFSRKRWCAFIWLQPLQQSFFAMKHNLMDSEYANQTLKQQLKIILHDDDIFWLILYRGFSPKFVDYCKGVRTEIGKSKNLRIDMYESETTQS